MVTPIGANPAYYQDIYYSAGTPPVASPSRDTNARQPGSVSDPISLNNKPELGDSILDKGRDCKT